MKINPLTAIGKFGFMVSRMKKSRKVIVGHWKNEAVRKQIANWTRVAVGWDVFRSTKVARIGDNMRDVAVTEGDKIEAQLRFGFSVNGYGVDDLVKLVNTVSESKVDQLVEEYCDSYIIDDKLRAHPGLRNSARIEI